MRHSGGEELIRLLADYGVDMVFGIPGVHTLAFYEPLSRSPIRHIGTRHEQGAAFMADGYARATGRPGVCLLISGPGVTNAATPVGQAYSDSVPLLAISSVIARAEMGLGRGMLHEITDQQALTRPITAMSVTAWCGEQISEHLAQAMTLFRTGRPRPAHLSIPLDVLDEPTEPGSARPRLPLPPGPHPKDISEAAKLVREANRPLIFAGGGCRNVGPELQKLAETLNAPVITTIAGKGAIPESHPLSLGSVLQRPIVRRLVEQKSDLIIAIGTEISESDLYVMADSDAPSDPVQKDTSRLHLSGKFIRIDIDPASTVRDYAPDVAIVSDAHLAVRALLEEFTRAGTSSRSQWQTDFVSLKDQLRQGLSPLEKQHVAVLDAVRSALPPDALVYADMTQIAYTGCVFFATDVPGTWHFPVGYGTLGYALPAAIGGALGAPGRACIAITGDGGFLFTMQELATAVEQKLPLPILLWDNDGLSEIADSMRSRNIPEISVRPHNPDFRELAQSFGCLTAEPGSLAELQGAIAQALSADRPTVIIVRQDSEYLHGS